MRTRTRNIVTRSLPSAAAVTGVVGVHYCNGSPSSYPPTSTGVMPGINLEKLEERMDDSLGKGKPHEVFHRKLLRRVNDESGPYGGVPNGTSYYDWSGMPAQWQLLPMRASVMNALSFDVNHKTLPPSRWTMTGSVNEDILKLDVYDKARGLQADMLLNTIEAHQLWPSIRSLAGSLPAMAKNWSNLRKVIRTASGSFLAWKFGVSPVLQDMMSLYRYLPQMGADINRVAEMYNRKYSSSARLTATFDASPAYVQILNGITTFQATFQGRIVKQPQIRYVLVVRPRWKHFNKATAALENAMSRFATSPANLAWEKVPFSFVLDWFVDLRGACLAIDNLLGFKPFEIVSFTRSYSYHVETDAFYAVRTPCNGASLGSGSAGSIMSSHYERTLVNSISSQIHWKPKFGKNQAAISAALIAQALFKK